MRATVGAAVMACALTAEMVGQDTLRFTPTVGYPTFAAREPVLRGQPSRTQLPLHHRDDSHRFDFGPIRKVLQHC